MGGYYIVFLALRENRWAASIRTVVLVGARPIEAPLPDVASHVVDAVSIGGNDFDAIHATSFRAGNAGVNALTTFAHEKRKVIEIKREVLRARPRRLFNRKIDALVTFSMTA